MDNLRRNRLLTRYVPIFCEKIALIGIRVAIFFLSNLKFYLSVGFCSPFPLIYGFCFSDLVTIDFIYLFILKMFEFSPYHYSSIIRAILVSVNNN